MTDQPPIRHIPPFGSDPQAELYQLIAGLVAESEQSGRPVGDLFTFQGKRIAIIVGTTPEQMDPFRGHIRPPASRNHSNRENPYG